MLRRWRCRPTGKKRGLEGGPGKAPANCNIVLLASCDATSGHVGNRTWGGGASQAPRGLLGLPPARLTLGWKTSLVNRTRGGLSGYCSLNVMRSWKMPPCGGAGPAAGRGN